MNQGLLDTARTTKQCFQINATDNTAVVLEDVAAATRMTVVGSSTRNITLNESIQNGHKVALVDIPAGGAIVKYGVAIGYATQDISAGDWVHLHNCASRYDERSSSLDTYTGAPTDTDYA